LVPKHRWLRELSTDFTNQVTLGDAADGGVARHLRDEVQIHGDHRRS